MSMNCWGHDTTIAGFLFVFIAMFFYEPRAGQTEPGKGGVHNVQPLCDTQEPLIKYMKPLTMSPGNLLG